MRLDSPANPTHLKYGFPNPHMGSEMGSLAQQRNTMAMREAPV